MESPTAAAQSKAPVSEDSRITMTLIASVPQIVTPIGVAVDALGRVLVLESHTQKPEKGNGGPKFDRVKAFVDADGEGVPGRIVSWRTASRRG